MPWLRLHDWQAGILMCLFSIVLSGCSIFPGASPMKPSFLQQPLPENWSLNGRISIIQDEENWYAKFSWQQFSEDFQISFSGPLGETELQIIQKGELTLIKTPSTVRQSTDPEGFVYQETGWHVPIHSLRYWVTGQADPSQKASIQYNEQQLITELRQDGWLVQFPRKVPVDGYQMPKKIIVTKAGLKIKMVITRWSLSMKDEAIITI
jgi:outer membrane lipoprotein LolB